MVRPVTCSRLRRGCAAWGMALGLVLPLAAQPEPQPRPQPELPPWGAATVTLEKGASLAESVAALSRATGCVVVADAAAAPGQLSEAFSGPVSDALPRVSVAYDRFWIARPRLLALQRQYSDHREPVELEREELKDAALTLHGLIRDLVPEPHKSEFPAQQQFLDSLTTAQIEQMRAGGLPFRSLRREQQSLWLRVNSTAGYSAPALGLAGLAHVMANWDRSYLERSASPREVNVWYCRTPDPPFPAAGRVFSVGLGADTAPRKLEAVLARGRADLARARGLAAAFKGRIRLPKQEWTLDELSRRIGDAAKTRLVVPAYARGRRLLVAPESAPVADVLFALEELYAWSVRYDARKGYSLGRPVFRAAPDGVQLKEMATQATPPPIRNILRREPNTARQHYQVGSIVEAVTKRRGPGWNKLALTELDAPEQDQLAVVLFLTELRGESRLFLDGVSMYYWLLTPEEGVFTWRQRTGKPSLVFSVERPGGGEDRWGWVVGSESPRR